jgi:F0F1-type ATP synthase membrane subunit b/b'
MRECPEDLGNFMKNALGSFSKAALVLLLLTSPALAAGGAGHHAPGISTLLWPAVNFCLFCGLAVWAYGKLVRPALVERAVDVERQLNRSAELRAEAERELEAKKRRLEYLTSEKDEMVTRLEKEGEAIAREVIESAHDSVRIIAENAERRVAGELAGAKSEIRREVIERAGVIARDRVIRELSLDDDQRLRAEAVASLSN